MRTAGDDRPSAGARRRLVSADGAAAAAPTVVYRKWPWTIVDLGEAFGRPSDRLAAMLADGRVCVSAAAWFDGDEDRAMAAVNSCEEPLAWTRYGGVLLVEAILPRLRGLTSRAGVTLDQIDRAVRAAVPLVERVSRDR
jgi:hypothetical protein